MIATFLNSASVLSIGIFFSLMVAGLSSKLPSTMFSGLTAQGVPAAAATPISHLPPIGVLFAAFLGYNPMQQLLGPLLWHLPSGARRVRDRPRVLPAPDHRAVPRRARRRVRLRDRGLRHRGDRVGAHRPAQAQRRVAPEALGSELAAVAGEGAFEPSELVVPGDVAQGTSEAADKPGNIRLKFQQAAGGVLPRGTSGAAQARRWMRVLQAPSRTLADASCLAPSARGSSIASSPCGRASYPGRSPMPCESGDTASGASGRCPSATGRYPAGEERVDKISVAPRTGVRGDDGPGRCSARYRYRGDALLVSETSPAAVVILAAGEGTSA